MVHHHSDCSHYRSRPEVEFFLTFVTLTYQNTYSCSQIFCGQIRYESHYAGPNGALRTCHLLLGHTKYSPETHNFLLIPHLTRAGLSQIIFRQNTDSSYPVGFTATIIKGPPPRFLRDTNIPRTSYLLNVSEQRLLLSMLPAKIRRVWISYAAYTILISQAKLSGFFFGNELFPALSDYYPHVHKRKRIREFDLIPSQRRLLQQRRRSGLISLWNSFQPGVYYCCDGNRANAFY